MALEIWTTDIVDSCARCRGTGPGIILRDARRYREESSIMQFCWTCWPKVVNKVAEAQGEAARAAVESAQ